MKNTGRSYETLVENLFNQILKQEQVDSIVIEKNKIVAGKSSNHEIDIYWGFQHAGINYQTLIQAKDWNNKVPQGELLKFKAVLDDIPGQPRGIFITKTGYQKGSIEVAEKNGILLYEFRQTTEEDTKDWLKTIHIGFQIFVPDAKSELEFDEDWIKDRMKSLGLKNFNINFTRQEDEFFLYNEDGSIFRSIRDISQQELQKLEKGVVRDRLVELEFGNKFIESGNDEIPRIRLKKLKLRLSQGIIKDQTIIEIPPFVGFILKNVIEGNEKLFKGNME